MILDDPAQVLFRCSLQEAVLRLWQVQTDAGTIMILCQIGEDELNEIIPRALWMGVKRTKCTRCDGRGSLSRAVPWEQDNMHRPQIEGAKAVTLDYQQVIEWRAP